MKQLTDIKSAFRRTLPMEEILSSVARGGAATVEHLVGSTPSLFVKILAEETPQLLVITPDEEAAKLMLSDLESLCARGTLFFPALGLDPEDPERVVDTALLVQRSEVLDRLSLARRFILVASANAVIEKVASADMFRDRVVDIRKGNRLEPHGLKAKLVEQGYDLVGFVDEPGEVAVRGGIVDVFSFSGHLPVRLEFFGDKVESIREFDPSTQRSVESLDKIRIIPNASEMPAERMMSLLSHLPKESTVILQQPGMVMAAVEERDRTGKRAEQLFLSANEFVLQVEERSRLFLGSTERLQSDASFVLDARPQPDFNSSIKLLRQDLQRLSQEGVETLILCDSDNQQSRLQELLGETTSSLKYNLTVESLHSGFVLPGEGVAVYTDHQIFNRYFRAKRQSKRYHRGLSFKEMRDLHREDLVVHDDFGIGRFMGFQTIQVEKTPHEVVVLEYSDGARLNVHVSAVHKVNKYSGREGSEAQISRLGSGEWARKKARTKRRLKDITDGLIKLYAKRRMQKAQASAPDGHWQTEIEARFEFEETPDQMTAIKEVKRDMEKSAAMDRLVCGDVGFGKTEVAIRAAFKTVMNGQQVAVIAPTTILVDQHSRTFNRRMQDFPVRIESLSRFRSSADLKKITADISTGNIDIAIGTHRLVSKDVQFKNLGLLVIDEEQRFGVTVKEKLKELRATVDVLTLTATPIPRTLQFSLLGVRDLSIIQTPPQNRQPIDTEIHVYNPLIIRRAITSELARNGQVFFIHNRVKDIEEMAAKVRDEVPAAHIRVAHGQMKPAYLQKIVADFYRGKFDILVSTNIVENGIDIANANTMIINRADRFGLAELHQLRGRVGRSDRKGHCLLLTPPLNRITRDARKRLMALEEFSDLGSGFSIAMRDLDIRGAGNILGAEQSGYINDLGYEMYMRILEDAVRELKEDQGVTSIETPHHSKIETSVDVDVPALLEEYYVEDSIERFNLYRRLSQAMTEAEVEEWERELRDRFGPLPENARNLTVAARMKLFASGVGLVNVVVKGREMILHCPDKESEAGKEFYEAGGFEKLLKKLDVSAAGQFKVVKEKKRVKFVIQDLESLDSALEKLRTLSKDDPTHEPIEQ